MELTFKDFLPQRTIQHAEEICQQAIDLGYKLYKDNKFDDFYLSKEDDETVYTLTFYPSDTVLLSYVRNLYGAPHYAKSAAEYNLKEEIQNLAKSKEDWLPKQHFLTLLSEGSVKPVV